MHDLPSACQRYREHAREFNVVDARNLNEESIQRRIEDRWSKGIKNKGKELILSMQVVVFLTVILSAILYHIENSVQPNNFGDIVDAFVWSLSKFIGGVGGYGDFEPITFWGQVMATIVGLLGIALFAVPAGIIGAGFVEEICPV